MISDNDIVNNTTNDVNDLINIIPVLLIIAPLSILISWIFGRNKNKKNNNLTIRQINKETKRLNKESLKHLC